MKALEKKLDICPKPEKEKFELPPMEEKPDQPIEFNEDHTDDILNDYKDIRSALKNTILRASSIMQKLDEAITRDIKCGETSGLARQAESFAKVAKIVTDSTKDLMENHGKFIDLICDSVPNNTQEESDEEIEETTKSAKSNLKRKKNLFDEE